MLICLFPSFLLAQENDLTINVALGIGEEFGITNTAVKFIKVISDSRCPESVTCIWPGEAKILLGVEFNGIYSEKEVIVSGGVSGLALTENFHLLDLSLYPYPKTPQGIAQKDYCIQFVGKRLKDGN